MNYRKSPIILATVLGLIACTTFVAVRSQGLTAKRVFFSQDLSKASAGNRPIKELMASAMLESMSEPAQGLTVLDVAAGKRLDVKILAEQLAYSPSTREIGYELATDLPCRARVLLLFNNSGSEDAEPRREERRLSFDDCEYQVIDGGTTIRWKAIAPDWATHLDGMILLASS